MTGYAARLIARATGARGEHAPLLPAFQPRFLPVLPGHVDEVNNMSEGAAPLPRAPPETGPQATLPPKQPREPPAVQTAQTRPEQPNVGSAGTPLDPESNAAKPATAPVVNESLEKGEKPVEAATANKSISARADPGSATVQVTGDNTPASITNVTVVRDAPASLPDMPGTDQPAPVLPRNHPMSAPLPRAAQPTLMASPPESAISHIDTPRVSIGRIDMIFEDAKPAAPRKRTAPNRTSGFEAYGRARFGQRR